MPQPTTPLPQVEEKTEPTPSENFATNEIEEVEAPKSIGNLIKNLFTRDKQTPG
jgi:hypothetical protein